MKKQGVGLSRKQFLRLIGGAAGGLCGWRCLGAVVEESKHEASSAESKYDWEKHKYAMLIDLQRCVGCGLCVKACKLENKVPNMGHTFRTWVERYVLEEDGSVHVDSPKGAIEGFPANVPAEKIFRSFFVPKLCNQCVRPPCVQVCPVGATYQTKEGVVLVDRTYCIGCRYCIEACPYGARYFHPELRVADKCTFCYHRVVKGLRPACVEVCPQNVRIFGDLKDPDSELVQILRRRPVQVLKPSLNTEPKVYYLNLDKEVR